MMRDVGDPNSRDVGVPGVLDPAGDSGANPAVSTERFRASLGPVLFLTMVMLRVIFTGAAPEEGDTTGADREAGKESYLRSLPRPDSGAGPASVSSQSLSRKPIVI